MRRVKMSPLDMFLHAMASQYGRRAPRLRPARRQTPEQQEQLMFAADQKRRRKSAKRVRDHEKQQANYYWTVPHRYYDGLPC